MNKFILVTAPAQTNPAYFTRDIDGTVNTDGFYETVVEANGDAGPTKLYVKSLSTGYLSGKMVIEKRQMNANLSDDVALSVIEIPFSTFNGAVNNAVLVHDWGKSENPIAIKMKVVTEFTGGSVPPSSSVSVDTWPFEAVGSILAPLNPLYASPFGGINVAFQEVPISERNYRYKGSKTLTGKNLTVKAFLNDTGQPFEFMIMKNGLPTGLTVTIPSPANPNVEVSNTVNNFTFTTNDQIALRGLVDGVGNIVCTYCTFEVEG